MAMIKCYDCGAQVSDRGKYCPTCGARVRKPAGLIGWLFVAAIVLAIWHINTR